MKKTLKLFISLFLVVVLSVSIMISANAVTYFKSGSFVYSRQSGYATIEQYDGDSAEVVIPFDFSDYIVDRIAISAFQNHNEITTLVLPEQLRFIDAAAFSNLSSLKNIVIPKFCQQVSSFVFSGCTALESVEFRTEKIEKIHERTFYDCSSLKKINIPQSVKSIGDAAFSNCTNLEFILIPKNVSEIADNAFSGVNNMTILCYKDSYAAEFAEQWNYNIIYIDDLLFGDANGDTVIDINDATIIQKKLLGISTSANIVDNYDVVADVNRDGIVNIRDVTLIQMYVAGIITEF